MSEPTDTAGEAGPVDPVEVTAEPAMVSGRQPGPGLLAAAGWVVVLVATQTAFTIAGAVFAGATAGPALVAFATTGTFLIAALVVGFVYGRAARRRLAIRPPGGAHLALVLLLPLPLVFAIGEITAVLADAARRAGVPERLIVPADLLALIDALRQYSPLPAVVGVVAFGGLLPGIGEELFFRGFLGRGLVARWGVARGVLATAVLFGVMHIHPLHAAMAALIGVGLHAVYLWTRSLVAPVVLHATYNGLAILGNVLTRGTANDLAADAHVPPALAATAAATSAGLVYLLYRTRVRWVWADGSDWSPGYATAEMPPAGANVRLLAHRLGSAPLAVVAVAYLSFLVALGWELAQ